MTADAERLWEAGLLNWPTMRQGLLRGLAVEPDAVELAVRQLGAGSDDEDVLRLASLTRSEENEAPALVERLVGEADGRAGDRPWELLALRDALESNEPDDAIVRALDEIYVAFDWPRELWPLGFYNGNSLTATKDELQQETIAAGRRIVVTMSRELAHEG